MSPGDDRGRPAQDGPNVDTATSQHDEPRMTRWPPPCADCGAPYGPDRSQVHQDSCPVGRDADATRDADRLHFLFNPGSTAYRRPLAWSEAVMLAAVVWTLPEGWRLYGEVTVRPFGPGVRTRDYSRVIAVRDGAW